MAKFNSQDQIVKAYMEQEPAVVTDKLRIPGIEQLHLLAYDEQAEKLTEILMNVVKSRARIQEIRWVFGDCIEVTYRVR